MLEAPGRVLPRPMSLSLAPPGELGFLFEAIGPGTNALAELEPGDRIGILGPLGNGFRLDVDRPLLVGGGIGVAPFPYLSQTLDRPDAILGFRSSHHAEAAELSRTRGRGRADTGDRTARAGLRRARMRPAPMLSAVRELAPEAQLAWEAPMACGYGACYGCVVEIGGHYKRLCLEGPVLVVTPPAASTRSLRQTPHGSSTPS
jgi:NAD(P)H-flavin reductase